MPANQNEATVETDGPLPGLGRVTPGRCSPLSAPLRLRIGIEPRSTKWATMAHSPAGKSLSGDSMVPLHCPSSWRSSPHHELPVGALRHVIPGADHRLETREGRVHLFRHRRL